MNTQIIKIRLSSSFLFRTKCKFCNGPPITYYLIKNATLWYSPRKVLDEFEWIRKHVKNMNKNSYYDNSIDLHSYNHKVSYKGYRPRLHRTRGSNPAFDVVEYLTCKCQGSTWAYSEKSIQFRPEIMQRKSKEKLGIK